MKLYHGTCASNLPRVLRSGLKGRGKRKGNWEHSILSHPEAVYLTNAYSLYYAMTASKNKRGVIFEIDTDRLNSFDMAPDEDFLGQAAKHIDDLQPIWDRFAGAENQLFAATEYFRDNIDEYQWLWHHSIDYLGNCCHLGPIPKDAITRYAVIPDVHRMVQWADPTISLMNFRILGDYYKALSSCLFGEWPEQDFQPEFGFYRLPTPEQLKDIEIVTLEKVKA